MKLLKVAKPKFRPVSSRRFRSGRSFVSSIQTKRASATAATTLRRVMKGEPNQSSLLPSSSTVWSAESPIAMVAMPVQSPWRRRSSRMGDGSRPSHRPVSIRAPGTRLM